ncbi:hypothetical protein ACOME3_001489 [Neoechinorhynchus agilis]
MGRPYVRGETLCDFLKREIIRLSNAGLPKFAIAETTRVSHSCVTKILKRHKNITSFRSHKNPRLKYTKQQIAILEEFYRSNPLPSKETQNDISLQLQIPTKNVKSWFGNRRFKDRKQTVGKIVCGSDMNNHIGNPAKISDVQHHYFSAEYYHANDYYFCGTNHFQNETANAYWPHQYNRNFGDCRKSGSEAKL